MGLALLLRTKVPGKNVFKVLLMLPWVVPIVVSSTAWNWLVATPTSPIPALAARLGFGELYFLADPTLAAITVCIFKVWVSFPFMMLMTSAALASVDTTVYEAAGMDGANRWQQFTQITLPLISRSTYISWILMTIFCVNDFPTIYLLTGGGPVDATTSLVVLAYRTVFQDLPDRPRRGDRLHHDLRPRDHLHGALPTDQEGGHQNEPQPTRSPPRPSPPPPSTRISRRPVNPGARTVVAVRRPRGDQPRGAGAGVRHRAVGDPTELDQQHHQPLTLENFTYVFANTDVLLWLSNSLGVTLATVAVSIVVAAPAGYVLSRGRSKAVSGYSLLLFVIQSLPVITAIIPLFMLFARIGLVDNLIGLVIVYVGSDHVGSHLDDGRLLRLHPPSRSRRRPGSTAAPCSAASSESSCATPCPASCRPRSSPSCSPGTTTSSRSCSSAPATLHPADRPADVLPAERDRLGLGDGRAVVMLLPPAIVFAALNKYFSVGGIGGSLAGR